MAEPARQSVFDSLDQIAICHDQLVIKPVPAKNWWNLRADEESAKQIARSLGLTHAPGMLRIESSTTHNLARLGPNEYLLSSHEEISKADIHEASQGAFLALVDISHRLTGIDIEGKAAPEVINGACPLDLHKDVTAINSCTRTIMAKAEIILTRNSQTSFTLLTNRSIMPYLLALTHELAREHDPNSKA